MNRYLVIIGVLILAAGALLVESKLNIFKDSPELDEFARCLRDKGVTMYGADWCPHCRNEKNRFGSSFRFVPYVECPDEPDKCLELGIKGYPTWVFQDGRKLEGEQGLEKLSSESGCLIELKVETQN